MQNWHQFHRCPWTTPAPLILPRYTGRPCLALTPTKPWRWATTARSWRARAWAPAVRSTVWPVARVTWFMWHPCQRAAQTCWTPPRPLFRQVRHIYHKGKGKDLLPLPSDITMVSFSLSPFSTGSTQTAVCSPQAHTELLLETLLYIPYLNNGQSTKLKKKQKAEYYTLQKGQKEANSSKVRTLPSKTIITVS